MYDWLHNSNNNDNIYANVRAVTRRESLQGCCSMYTTHSLQSGYVTGVWKRVRNESTYDLVSRPVLDERPVPAATAVLAAERPDLSAESVSDCGVNDVAALCMYTNQLRD